MHLGNGKMVILYSSRTEVIHHWQSALATQNYRLCHNEKELLALIEQFREDIILCVECRQYEDIGGFLSFLKEDCPNIKTILFSNKPSYLEGTFALKFGIKAYANTYMAHIHIQDALNTVKSGNVWLYPEFIQKMIEELSQQQKPLHVSTQNLEKLSEREKQIALLVKEGLSNKEIAHKAEITERTVKAHLGAIFEKLGIKDRLSLALLI